jgi:hypothetical protein
VEVKQDLSYDKPLISVMIIATKRYVEFLPDLIESIGNHLVPGFNIDVVVFTDQVEFVDNIRPENKQLFLIVKEIPSYGWPNATLLRYEIFEQNWNLVRGEIAMYLDADTRLIRDIPHSDFQQDTWKKEVALVRHPAYFGRSLIFMLMMKMTKRGPWESNPLSTARVRMRHRRRYVYGGVWMGTNKGISIMVRQLAENVRIDTSNEFIAKWHDESHINKWFVENGPTALDPSWAFTDFFPHLDFKKLNPRVELITKDIEFALEKTD